MYIEFGYGTVPAPPIAGLIELADRHNGTITVTPEGASIHLPFNEKLNLLRKGEDTTVLEFNPPAQVKRPEKKKVPKGAHGMGALIIRKITSRVSPVNDRFILVKATG